MIRTSTITLVLSLFLTWSNHAQPSLINGPMNAYSSMLEVTVWVQTFKEQNVHMRYWVKGKPD